MWHVGIDLHLRTLVVAAVNDAGEVKPNTVRNNCHFMMSKDLLAYLLSLAFPVCSFVSAVFRPIPTPSCMFLLELRAWDSNLYWAASPSIWASSSP